MKANIFWALIFHGISIPLAISGLIDPAFAATLSVFSSLAVVMNSLRIRSFRPKEIEQDDSETDIADEELLELGVSREMLEKSLEIQEQEAQAAQEESQVQDEYKDKEFDQLSVDDIDAIDATQLEKIMERSNRDPEEEEKKKKQAEEEKKLQEQELLRQMQEAEDEESEQAIEELLRTAEEAKTDIEKIDIDIENEKNTQRAKEEEQQAQAAAAEAEASVDEDLGEDELEDVSAEDVVKQYRQTEDDLVDEEVDAGVEDMSDEELNKELRKLEEELNDE